MVHIKKGHSELTVSRGAYENFYRRCGYELTAATEANEQPMPHEKVHPENSHSYGTENASEVELEEEDTEEQEEEPAVDYSEIPLSELNYEQLCDYADQLGLDHDGIKSAKGLRSLIKANL